MTTADIDPGRARDVIETGRASLGIEFGSTNIKACLIGPDYTPLASGSHAWENEFVDGRWTYSLEAVWAGLQACYADLVTDVQRLYDVTPTSFRAIGISAMMHGYLAFDEAGDLLVPFRTWRNTSTGPAAVELTEAL
ncbi:MAG: FGGY family carbohydrate kinase, partial [Cutibacterium avidum]|nr:FGGY family carbohydrate kinase [Cutibacterium avidum]